MVLETEIQSGAMAWATVLSLVLVIVSWMSYRRARERRVLLLTVAFGFFFAKNVVLSILLVAGHTGAFPLTSAILDTAVLLGFYAALLRRPRG